MTTPLQQAATELMDAMVKTDFTCRLGEQLDALEKALETEQAQAVEPIGYVRHADKTFWPHPECAVYASVSPSLAPVYAHPAPPLAGERAELIADLRLNHEYCPKEVILEAADMLEADVSLINEGNKAQQVAVPDMFWNHDDADKLYSSISEFLNDEICNGTELAVGDIRTIQRAVRLPNVDIRITSVDEDECDAEYEIVEAQGAKP